MVLCGAAKAIASCVCVCVCPVYAVYARDGYGLWVMTQVWCPTYTSRLIFLLLFMSIDGDKCNPTEILTNLCEKSDNFGAFAWRCCCNDIVDVDSLWFSMPVSAISVYHLQKDSMWCMWLEKSRAPQRSFQMQKVLANINCKLRWLI